MKVVKGMVMLPLKNLRKRVLMVLSNRRLKIKVGFQKKSLLN